MARYVQAQIGQYPAQPRVGSKKVKAEPRNSDPNNPITALSSTSVDDGDTSPEEEPPADYPVPGCEDKFGQEIPSDVISASISSQHAQATAV